MLALFAEYMFPVYRESGRLRLSLERMVNHAARYAMRNMVATVIVGLGSVMLGGWGAGFFANLLFYTGCSLAVLSGLFMGAALEKRK